MRLHFPLLPRSPYSHFYKKDNLSFGKWVNSNNYICEVWKQDAIKIHNVINGEVFEKTYYVYFSVTYKDLAMGGKDGKPMEKFHYSVASKRARGSLQVGQSVVHKVSGSRWLETILNNAKIKYPRKYFGNNIMLNIFTKSF